MCTLEYANDRKFHTQHKDSEVKLSNGSNCVTNINNIFPVAQLK